MRRGLGALAVAVAVAALPVRGVACGKGAVLFSDDFTHPEPYWDVTGNHVRFVGTTLQVEPAQNANWYVWYAGMPYTRADACVMLSIDKFHAAGDMGAGLLFWTRDRDLASVFMIRPDGGWILARHLGRDWVPVDSGMSDAIRTGPGVENEVEVRLDGKLGEAWVNGTKVTDFAGVPPPGGTAFGYYAESEVDETDVWTFHSMQVRRLEAPLAGPEGAAPGGGGPDAGSPGAGNPGAVRPGGQPDPG